MTDKLRSYGAAMKQPGLTGHECEGRWINIRVENSLRGPSVRTSHCDEENGPKLTLAITFEESPKLLFDTLHQFTDLDGRNADEMTKFNHEVELSIE